MKILASVLFLFKLNVCISQVDSVPILVSLRLNREYVTTIEKKSHSILYEIGQEGSVIKSDSVKRHFFDIEIEVKNTSDTVVQFWAMTCSWYNNFTINNNYISFKSRGCDANYPRLVKLKPNESKFYSTTLSKSIKFEYPCLNCIYGPQVKTTKLGLIIVDDIFSPKHGMLSYKLAMEDKSLWKVIWSNPLYLLSNEEADPNPVQIPIYRKMTH